MIKIYVDDYTSSLTIPRYQKDLNHLANATMHGMHSVFPADEEDSNDQISVKKLIKTDGQWNMDNVMLG